MSLKTLKQPTTFSTPHRVVLEYDSREQRSKGDEGIILQVRSYYLPLPSVPPLWDPSPCCDPYLSLIVKKAQHFLTRAKHGSTYVHGWTCDATLLLLGCRLSNSPFKTWAVHRVDFIWLCTVQAPLSWYLLWEETSVSRERALCISPALWTIDPADCYWLDASQQTRGARSCGIIIRPNAKNCWMVEIRWFTVNTSRNWRLYTGWIKLSIYTVHQKAVDLLYLKISWLAGSWQMIYSSVYLVAKTNAANYNSPVRNPILSCHTTKPMAVWEE